MQGTLIEYNADVVDAAIAAVRQALAAGLGWKELKALIRCLHHQQLLQRD